MVEQSIWMQKVAADPGHSHWYIERFRAMARAGDDLAGEARFVDAKAPRGARILDAGCGPGRLVGDLAELDLPARGITDPFDVIVSAGNVMTFLAPSTRVLVLSRLRAHLAADGRAAIGFGAYREYEFTDFLNDAADAGFAPDLLLSSWDLRPFTEDSEFLVAVLRPA